MLIRGFEGIWMNGSCVRNAKNRDAGKRVNNKKPNPSLVNGA